MNEWKLIIKNTKWSVGLWQKKIESRIGTYEKDLYERTIDEIRASIDGTTEMKFNSSDDNDDDDNDREYVH